MNTAETCAAANIQFSFIGELNAALNASGTPTARPMSEPI